jgi:hypothetical protein
MAAALAAFVLTGCGAIRFGSETPVTPPPALAGAWTGSWTVEGQRLDGTLSLRQNGTGLNATFTSKGLGGDAIGTGKVDGQGRLSLELKYRTTCAGTAKLTGALNQGGQLGGAVAATDCTGKASGTFSFRRS